MKRYGNLFEKTFSIDNLYAAYLDARKGKRAKRSCFEFEKHLGWNLKDLCESIYNGSYSPREYFQFVVYEPKRRIIHAPQFRDVVVQHAIYRIIYDIFNKSFISTSFACRVGYGTHKAAHYTRNAMRQYSGDAYYLKLDIRKFFYSINRALLRKMIERKIKEKRLVDMIMVFAEMELAEGIPIGNLLSQIFALIYLNPLDHFVKRVLKVKHYVRYVDDFILIGFTHAECLEYKNKITQFLQDTLSLNLSKSTIQQIRKGINFCGYRMWRSISCIRKHSLFKFKRAVRKGKQPSIDSLLGHAKHTNSLRYMLRIIREERENGTDIQIPKNYRLIYNSLPS